MTGSDNPIDANRRPIPGFVVVFDIDGVNDLRTTFSLSPGEILENREFAYRGDAEIGDTVWRDDNRNGIDACVESTTTGPTRVGARFGVAFRWLDERTCGDEPDLRMLPIACGLCRVRRSL